MLGSLILLSVLCYSALSFARLECRSADGVSYLSEGKMGGAAPFPGQILNITEIKKNDEILFRKVSRQGCWDENFCHMDRPEINDINADQEIFHFQFDTKHVLSSEGSQMGPVFKETYAIKASMENEFWMICESFTALYP